jgi:hypothetical protein
MHEASSTSRDMLPVNVNIDSVALVCERTILNEQHPLVGEVSDNFCG